MITEVYRFRYSDLSDLAIGRDDQGHPWFQSWAPDPETGARATKPLGWSAYRLHSGLEEAEELLRLKAELDRLKERLSWLRVADAVRLVQPPAEGPCARALRRLMRDPHGCSLCDWGTPRNPAKGHQPDCAWEAARRALAEQPEPQAAAVDAGAVREVAVSLRAQAARWGHDEPPLPCRSMARAYEEYADRLDAALGGAGEGAAEKDQGGMVLVPLEPPDSIPKLDIDGSNFSDELFDLCRNDDYRGLYRALIRRATGRSKEA